MTLGYKPGDDVLVFH